MTIATMPAWHFWTKPSFVGLSEDEIDRELPPERIAEINFRLDTTYAYLRDVPVDNRCGRCS